MPSPRILDLSPIPNEMGRQFGENFAGGFQRGQDRRWFDEAVGEETDPYLQLQKMRQSQHPFSPEFSKERRRDLFEDMDARMARGREDREVARRQREENRENVLWGREDDKYQRALKQDERNLGFLEQQMGLSPGSLSGVNPEFVRPIAQKVTEEQMKRSSEARNKNALASAYQEELADLPQETFNNMTEKQVENYVKNKQKPTKSGLNASDPAVKLAYDQYKDISSLGKTADDTLKTVKEARAAVEQGGGDVNLSNVLGKVMPWFKSGSTATLENAGVELFKHFKTIFPRMTNVDVGLIEDILPSFGKSREANNAILDIYETGANMAKEKQRIADDLVAQMNRGEFPAYEFQQRLRNSIDPVEDEALEAIRETATAIHDRVLERVDEGYTPMMSMDGELAQIPNDRVEEALKSKQWRLYGR